MKVPICRNINWMFARLFWFINLRKLYRQLKDSVQTDNAILLISYSICKVYHVTTVCFKQNKFNVFSWTVVTCLMEFYFKVVVPCDPVCVLGFKISSLLTTSCHRNEENTKILAYTQFCKAERLLKERVHTWGCFFWCSCGTGR